MEDRSKNDEEVALSRIPLLLAAILALVALLIEGGYAFALVVAAFFVGYLPATKLLFFVDTIEERRALGRETLHRLSDQNVEEILQVVRAGRKIEAIKMLRAVNHDGLKEAKEAVELLNDFGLKWRDSIAKPPA